MRITNCGRGVHKREVVGIELLKNELPDEFYAYTNLDLALGVNTAREIDVILVTNRRIFVLDLKDWNGRISSAEGRWFLGKKDMDSSPVAKVNGIAREISILLKANLARRPEAKGAPAPRVEGLVVLTGNADRTDIAETEREKVLTINEFLSSVASDAAERRVYGNVAPELVDEPLTTPKWRGRLSIFFNANTSGAFRPGRRRFHRFVPEELSSFEHPDRVYREYDAKEDGAPPSYGTLRIWDFAELKDVRFQTEEGRREIAGRERRIYHWLRDRSAGAERSVLAPRVDDPTEGVDYWEIFDRRQRLKRLSDFAATEAAFQTTEELVELARQLLSAVAEFHRQSAAHLDIGAHSVWLEAPTTVRLSHLFATRFPEVQSLGSSRYQFLASVPVPEDIVGGDAGPFRRDVFLLAVAVHTVLFGSAPASVPPEWDPSVDVGDRFGMLHDWFAEALDADASQRFRNAEQALEAFNKATVVRPTAQEVAVALDGFRGRVRSQTALVAAFPVHGSLIRDTDAIDMWRSVQSDQPVAVKMWKQAAWGDTQREGGRLLAFLEHARGGRVAAGCIPRVLEVYWLADAMAIVSEWVPGDDLDVILSSSTASQGARETLSDACALVDALSELHDAGLSHGDLKPSNVVRREGGGMAFIDVLDFRPLADGEIQNGEFGGLEGDRFQRDRRAVIRICERLLERAPPPRVHSERIRTAASACLADENGRVPHLHPFSTALRDAFADVNGEREEGPSEADCVIRVAIRGAETGVLEPDEGRYYMRSHDRPGKRPAIVLRGAAEEIEFWLDDRRQPVSGFRRAISQTSIGIVSKRELLGFRGTIEVTSASYNDLRGVVDFLVRPEAAAALSNARKGVASDGGDEDRTIPSEEEGLDALVDEAADGVEQLDSPVDVPRLWRELMRSEEDLTTEGVALVDSVFDRRLNAHRVGFTMESGTFDFNKNDTVAVQRAGKGGVWRRLGEVDIANSQASSIVIEPSFRSVDRSTSVVQAGTRLRFVSHFETESIRRRSAAVGRILGGGGRAANLLSAFDPRSGISPAREAEVPTADALKPYGLNDDQVAALGRIVTTRPMGLLQGPPGTGKTRFIAALAHYAITNGLARNILLSSQSHEAVNTATEALLKLFRSSGGDLSMVRVAVSEDQVSDPVRPFHAQKLEQAFKDRFRATFKERVSIAAATLGLTAEAAADAILFETTLRPLAGMVLNWEAQREDDRLRGLTETLANILEQLGLSPQECLSLMAQDADELLHGVRSHLLASHSRRTGAGVDRLNRLFEVARLGSDFIGSASRARRSFEPFIAGTRQLVAGTCVGLGRTSLALAGASFDLVIVDEAARCTASELLVPLQAGKWVVLVGDHAQLEPHHRPEVVNDVSRSTGIPKSEIRRSDFERVFGSGYGEAAGARLHTQYRMLPPIGRLVSEVFYEDLVLRPGRTEPVIPASALPETLSVPLAWVETDSLGEVAYEKRDEEGRSRTNRVEADLIVAMLERWKAADGFERWLADQKDHAAAVGVICMYASQRDLVYRKLLKSSLAEHLDRGIKVGTVDSYQGKENPIVLVSLVRNNADGPIQRDGASIREGFLGAPNRINVAASRAMDGLVFFGAQTRWRRSGPMARLVDAFRKQAKEGTATTLAASDVFLPQEERIGRSNRKGWKPANA